MDTAPPIPDPPLLLFLASFEGAGIPADEVEDPQIARWRAAEAGYQCAANAARYLQGRALAARLEHIDHGERLAWKDQIGEALSLSRRSIELRVQIATGLDEIMDEAGGQSAGLRRSLLDRPWRDVLEAVKAALGQEEEEEEDEDFEDDFSLAPEPDPEPLRDLTESRWTEWKTQLATIEEETFDSLHDVEQWVQLLQHALERAEERREELADEVTEVPAGDKLREHARPRRPRPGFVAPRARSFAVSLIEPE